MTAILAAVVQITFSCRRRFQSRIRWAKSRERRSKSQGSTANEERRRVEDRLWFSLSLLKSQLIVVVIFRAAVEELRREEIEESRINYDWGEKRPRIDYDWGEKRSISRGSIVILVVTAEISIDCRDCFQSRSRRVEERRVKSRELTAIKERGGSKSRGLRFSPSPPKSQSIVAVATIFEAAIEKSRREEVKELWI